jgi:hypothetical protein
MAKNVRKDVFLPIALQVIAEAAKTGKPEDCRNAISAGQVVFPRKSRKEIAKTLASKYPTMRRYLMSSM